jgi:hypothetical protein
MPLVLTDSSGNTTGSIKTPYVVTLPYAAASVDMSVFVAPYACRVSAITARVTAAGTDGSAVTCLVKKAPSGTAIASGTTLSSSIDLKGTANTNQTITLTTTLTDLDIAAGTAVGLDFTGTLTSATGVVCLLISPI